MERLGEFVERDIERASRYAETVEDMNIRWADNQRAWELIQFAASKHRDPDVIFGFVAEAWEFGLDLDDKEFKLWRDREKSRKRQKPDPLDRVYEFANQHNVDGDLEDDERDCDTFSLSYGRESMTGFSAGRTTAYFISRERGKVKRKSRLYGARVRTNDDQNSDRERAIDIVAEKYPDMLPMFIDQLDGMTSRQIAEKHGSSKTTVERKLDRVLRELFPAYKAKRDAEALQRCLESLWDEQERWASDHGIDLDDLHDYTGVIPETVDIS